MRRNKVKSSKVTIICWADSRAQKQACWMEGTLAGVKQGDQCGQLYGRGE